MHAWQSYIVFIVRDRGRPTFSSSAATTPGRRTTDGRTITRCTPIPTASLGSGRSVSFDRPYGKYAQIFDNPLSVGSGEFLLWEFPLSYWLEKHGYDVTYCSNSDMIDPAQIRRASVFLSVGHDEYWDPRQYDAAHGGVQGRRHAQCSCRGNCGLRDHAFQPAESGQAEPDHQPRAAVTAGRPRSRIESSTNTRSL